MLSLLEAVKGKIIRWLGLDNDLLALRVQMYDLERRVSYLESLLSDDRGDGFVN